MAPLGQAQKPSSSSSNEIMFGEVTLIEALYEEDPYKAGLMMHQSTSYKLYDNDHAFWSAWLRKNITAIRAKDIETDPWILKGKITLGERICRISSLLFDTKDPNDIDSLFSDKTPSSLSSDERCNLAVSQGLEVAAMRLIRSGKCLESAILESIKNASKHPHAAFFVIHECAKGCIFNEDELKHFLQHIFWWCLENRHNQLFKRLYYWHKEMQNKQSPEPWEKTVLETINQLPVFNIEKKNNHLIGRAIKGENLEVLDLLLDMGVGLQGPSGPLCLHRIIYATGSDTLACNYTKSLIKAGAAPDVLCGPCAFFKKHRDTFLHSITYFRASLFFPLLDLCIELKPELNRNIEDRNGYTPFHCTILQPDLKYARYWVDKGANPHHPCQGSHPIFLLTKISSSHSSKTLITILDFFLELDTDVNVQDTDGNTLLIAELNRSNFCTRENFIKYLIHTKGADISRTNKAGQSAASIIKDNGWEHLLDPTQTSNDDNSSVSSSDNESFYPTETYSDDNSSLSSSDHEFF